MTLGPAWGRFGPELKEKWRLPSWPQAAPDCEVSMHMVYSNAYQKEADPANALRQLNRQYIGRAPTRRASAKRDGKERARGSWVQIPPRGIAEMLNKKIR